MIPPKLNAWNIDAKPTSLNFNGILIFKVEDIL